LYLNFYIRLIIHFLKDFIILLKFELFYLIIIILNLN